MYNLKYNLIILGYMQFTDFIKAYLNNQKIEYQDTPKYKKLVDLAIEQSLQTILYQVFNYKPFKKYYVSWVIKQDLFLNLQKKITSIFNSNQIKHVYFKGAILSNLYDDPSIRTRGDIDLYIDAKDFNKAENALLENGFVKESKVEDSMHHKCYINNGITIELHFALFEPGNNPKWLKTYKDVFSLCELEDGSLYKFKDTYHLLYCLMHFAHHLRTGAGMRYILDFYYMFKKINIDMKLLHQLLRTNDLEVLYKNVINEIRLITDNDFDSTVPSIDIEFFNEYLLSYGIHGHERNETDSRTAARKNKVKYFFVRIFLANKQYRITRFPKIGKYIILYPIMLIIHWSWLLTHRFKSFIKFAFGKNKNKDLYEKLGI